MGNPVDQALSDSYYKHRWKQKIIYSPMGNWFELGYTEMTADAATFTVLSRDFGKDNKNIFWKGYAQQVDYATFRIDEHNIPKDAKHVYSTLDYRNELKIVLEADPATYKPYLLANETYGQQWHRDHQAVFLYGKKVDAYGKTFVRLNQSLAVDSLYLYAIVYDYNGMGSAETNTSVIRKKERPSHEAEVINDYYVRFGNSIALSNWKNSFAYLQFEKIENYRIIDERNIVVNDQLVSDGELMPDIDVSSLVILDRDFIKDKNAVYYDKVKITAADPGTFTVISEVYSKDRQNVYFKTQLLNQADPTNFNVNYATGIASDGKLSFRDGVLIQE
jgi:hypothetical protein